MFGNINLKNGLEIKTIKIKKDFEIMNQFFVDDPNEFKNLEFIIPDDIDSTTINLKNNLNLNYEYYKILDNKNVIGYLQTYFSNEASSLIIMLSANYSGGKSLASIIVHFKNKIIKFANVSIIFSKNDYTTTHLLESVGVSSNILYLSGEDFFQFIGNNFEAAQPEDWEEINSKISFVDFFNIDNIKWAQDSNNNYSNNESLTQTESNDESENNVDDEDDIYIDENEEQVVIPNSGNMLQESSHALTGFDNYGNPINYVPENNSTYVGTKGKDGSLNANHVLSKVHPTNFNVSEYVKEISKIPTNIKYSKINPDLFTTIKGTPTFNKYEDSSLDDNRSIKKLSFSQILQLKNSQKPTRKIGFGNTSEKIDVLNTRNTSFQDMIKARKSELSISHNNDKKNKTKNTKHPSFGFGSGVITI